MILVKPSFEILAIYRMSGIEGLGRFGDPLELIELAGRTCYKSEDKISEGSAKKFAEMISKRGHESVIEHSAMTVKFIVDRGVTHELVRHRLCAFSQESTRYCNYKGGVTFVIPPWVTCWPGEYLNHRMSEDQTKGDAETCWFNTMLLLEENYKRLINDDGWSPQQARSVLPNSLKTEVVVTANFREWRHILRLRTSKAAHPQMREVMLMLLEKVKAIIPVIFDDISVES